MLVEWCQVEEARFVKYFIILGVLLPACSARFVATHCKVRRWRCDVGATQKDVSSGSGHNAPEDAVKKVAVLTSVCVCWTDDSTILLFGKRSQKEFDMDSRTLIW